MAKKHTDKLMDNRLRRIENRLRKIEVIFLKNHVTDKKIKKELIRLEKEEKIIEHEQRKLEDEENQILKEMRAIEDEEKWHIELQYNCKYKVMDDTNVINCSKTAKLCCVEFCPLWKSGKKVVA